jgi:hypothetical protein
MLRSFSKELIEDREFEIGGEVFEFIYPHWEIGAKIFDDSLVATKKNGDEPAEPDKFFWKNDTKMAIEKIPMFLNPKNDALNRFKALAARKTDAVPRYQFVQLYSFLVAVTGNLPTNLPSSTQSDGGAGKTEAESAGGSPSTEATSTA